MVCRRAPGKGVCPACPSAIFSRNSKLLLRKFYLFFFLFALTLLQSLLAFSLSSCQMIRFTTCCSNPTLSRFLFRRSISSLYSLSCLNDHDTSITIHANKKVRFKDSQRLKETQLRRNFSNSFQRCSLMDKYIIEETEAGKALRSRFRFSFSMSSSLWLYYF